MWEQKRGIHKSFWEKWKYPCGLLKGGRQDDEVFSPHPGQGDTCPEPITPKDEQLWSGGHGHGCMPLPAPHSTLLSPTTCHHCHHHYLFHTIDREMSHLVT